MLRLGIDVDGVVADFRAAFRALAERELGSGAPPREADLAKPQIDRLWRTVAATPNWWLDLPAYEPDQIARLYARARQSRWEVFFMTSRPVSDGFANVASRPSCRPSRIPSSPEKPSARNPLTR